MTHTANAHMPCDTYPVLTTHPIPQYYYYYDESEEGEGRVHPNTNPNLTLNLRPILTSVVVRQWATYTYERDWCDGDK